MKLKKSISLILTLALVLSASLAVSSFNISANASENLISGGDFEGSQPLENFYHTKGSANSASVVNYSFDDESTSNKAVKLMRSETDDPNGRAISYDLKALNLTAGSYKLTFDADVINTTKNGYAFYYGVYSGTYDQYGMFYSNEINSSNSSIVTNAAANTFVARATGSLNGVVAHDAGNKGIRLSFSGTTEDTAKAKMVLEFNVDGTETDLYFSAGVTKGVTAYIDNVTLVSTERITDGVLVTPNSDFEEGNLTGFVAGANVKVVNKPEKATDETTFIGSAAYLGPRTNADTSNLTYAMTIPAGKYKVSFDLDVFAGTTGGNIIVGLYKGTPDSYNRGYASTNELIDAPKAYDKQTSSVYSYAEDYKWGNGTVIKFANTGDNENLKFVFDFEVTEETTAFLGIGFSSNSTDYAYLDNIKVTVADSDELLTNGNFEYGSLYGYTYSYGTNNPTAADRITVTDGKAHIPARTTVGAAYGRFLNQAVELEAGDYVFSFDADITYGTAAGKVYFAVGDSLESGLERVLTSAIGTSSASFTVDGSANAVKYYNNLNKTGAFTLENTDRNISGNAKIYLTLAEKKTVYFSIGINDVNTTADIYNLSLKKSDNSEIALTEVPTTGMFTASRTMDENYFIPYGGASASDGTILSKDKAGWFNTVSYKNQAINTVYFKKPSADGITTFGASYKADEDTTKNGIQFGSYTENVENKEFYTLIIRGSNEAQVNALTTEQKTAMVNKYLTWNSALADKWGKLTVDGTKYEIKVVKQRNYMWKDADTDNTKLQYAVRLYGAYTEGTNGDINFSAIGFSKSGNTVSFADSFKTASYNGLKN